MSDNELKTRHALCDIEPTVRHLIDIAEYYDKDAALFKTLTTGKKYEAELKQIDGEVRNKVVERLNRIMVHTYQYRDLIANINKVESIGDLKNYIRNMESMQSHVDDELEWLGEFRKYVSKKVSKKYKQIISCANRINDKYIIELKTLVTLEKQIEEIKKSERYRSQMGRPKKQRDGESVFKHSADYRCVELRGKTYQLTVRQAYIIEILHEAYLKGTPYLSMGNIMMRVDTDKSKLKDTFKSKKHKEIYKALIVKGEYRDLVRLNI